MEREVIATVCFPLRGGSVLLGMKKRGMGAGWWNGFGGKVLERERLSDCVLRELAEESGLVAQEDDLLEVARMRFYLPDSTVMVGHAYTLYTWVGEPQETEEMRPEWFQIEKVPYDTMWPGDDRWLPLILQGRRVEGEIRFGNSTAEVVSSRVEDAQF